MGQGIGARRHPRTDRHGACQVWRILISSIPTSCTVTTTVVLTSDITVLLSTIDVQHAQEAGSLSQVVLHLRLLVVSSCRSSSSLCPPSRNLHYPPSNRLSCALSDELIEGTAPFRVRCLPDTSRIIRLCFDFDGLRQLTDRCKWGYRLHLRADRQLVCPCLGSDGVIHNSTLRGGHHQVFAMVF